MVTKRKPTPDDAVQFDRFKQAAKEAGLDETGERFEKAFKKIVPEKGRPSGSPPPRRLP